MGAVTAIRSAVRYNDPVRNSYAAAASKCVDYLIISASELLDVGSAAGRSQLICSTIFWLIRMTIAAVRCETGQVVRSTHWFSWLA